MTAIKYDWSLQNFDAIAIRAFNCELEVTGTDSDRVSLDGELSGKVSRISSLDVSGKWLRFNALSHAGNSKLVLKLPVRKAWVVSVSAGRGDIRCNNILARLHVMLGRGDVEIENSRGVIAVAAGHGDVRVRNFVQADVPQRPSASPGQTPAGARPLRGDWLRWTAADWEHWGDAIGQRMESWGEELGLKLELWGEEVGRRFEGGTVSGRFFERTGIDTRNAGGIIEIVHGDIKCRDIEATGWLTRVARGDIDFHRGKIGGMEVSLQRGDVKCRSVTPDGKWFIRTIHGDIRLVLPTDVSARLDMATRYGQIKSEVPLVRVARQGPETQYGGRMVGAIGTRVEGKDIALSLSTVHGDIEVSTRAAGFEPQPETADLKKQSSPARGEEEAKTYRTPLDVLQALSEKKLTVEEAEKLLREMKTR